MAVMAAHRRYLLETSTVSVGPDNTMYYDTFPKPDVGLKTKQTVFAGFFGVLGVLVLAMHTFFLVLKCVSKEWRTVHPEGDAEGGGRAEEEEENAEEGAAGEAGADGSPDKQGLSGTR